MEEFNIYAKLQNFFISDDFIDINKIVDFINENGLLGKQTKSFSTMKLLASIVYSHYELLDQVVQILKSIKKIDINIDFYFSEGISVEVRRRTVMIYVLLCLSGHINFGDIFADLTTKEIAFINPVYISKFHNNSYLNSTYDFSFIQQLSNDEKIKYRNKIHSTHPIVQAILNDDIDVLADIISKSNFDINCETIPKSLFEINDFLFESIPIEFAAFLGSTKCFKYLLLNSKYIDYDKLFKYAIAGGNCEIIHTVEEKCEIESNHNYLLDLAILYMRNDIIPYLINNFDIKINVFNYINCIYASNYDALNILKELDDADDKVLCSYKDFLNYFEFMFSVPGIIGLYFGKGWRDDIILAFYKKKRFDVMEYINNLKYTKINDEVNFLNIVFKYREEQLMSDFKNIEKLIRQDLHSYFFYLDFDDDFFGDYDYDDYYFDLYYDYKHSYWYCGNYINGFDVITKRRRERLRKNKKREKISQQENYLKEEKFIHSKKQKNSIKRKIELDKKEYYNDK